MHVFIHSFIPPDAVWEWEDEGHHWIPYTDTDNQTIEEAHSAGDTVVALTILGRVYNLNLKKMTQENMSTNVVRNIRRVLPNNKPHPPVPAASASSSKTRGKNKRPKEEEEDDDDDEDIVISKKRKKVKGRGRRREREEIIIIINYSRRGGGGKDKINWRYMYIYVHT